MNFEFANTPRFDVNAFIKACAVSTAAGTDYLVENWAAAKHKAIMFDSGKWVTLAKPNSLTVARVSREAFAYDGYDNVTSIREVEWCEQIARINS